ncbi:MAG: leucine-rich repeat domain-containing protein [Eubacteriales bacterium]
MNDQKKLFWHRLFLLVVVLIFAVVFFLLALQFGDDLDAEYTWHELSDGTVAIEGYTGSPSKLKIPETIDGKTVGAIYPNAFAYLDELKSVTVPATVRVIGEGAFYGCDSLNSVELSEGLEEIGRSAFEKCSYLKEINLPESLKTIGEDAFNGCTRLSGLKIPAGCTAIGDDAFIGCESLTLDCSENALALDYAGRYQIPTGFANSNGRTYLLLSLAVGIPVVLLAVLWFVLRTLRRRRESKKYS